MKTLTNGSNVIKTGFILVGIFLLSLHTIPAGLAASSSNTLPGQSTPIPQKSVSSTSTATTTSSSVSTTPQPSDFITNTGSLSPVANGTSTSTSTSTSKSLAASSTMSVSAVTAKATPSTMTTTTTSSSVTNPTTPDDSPARIALNQIIGPVVSTATNTSTTTEPGVTPLIIFNFEQITGLVCIGNVGVPFPVWYSDNMVDWHFLMWVVPKHPKAGRNGQVDQDDNQDGTTGTGDLDEEGNQQPGSNDLPPPLPEDAQPPAPLPGDSEDTDPNFPDYDTPVGDPKWQGLGVASFTIADPAPRRFYKVTRSPVR